MRNPMLVMVTAAMLLAVTFTACKKDEKDEELDARFKQFNEDNSFVKGEVDQADNDINTSLSDIPAFGKVAGVQSSPLCGATIDSSQIAQKILFFNFDGVTPCFH